MKPLWALCLALLLALLGPGQALAQDQVITDDFTLTAGQTINGAVVVMKGNVALQAGSTVNGNLAVFGGNVTVAGHVAGDVTVFGGQVTVLASATITGQAVESGGTLVVQNGAAVTAPPYLSANPPAPNFWETSLNMLVTLLVRLASTLGLALGLGVVAALTALVLPDPLQRVVDTLRATLPVSGVVGLLTLLVAPLMMFITAITLCLLPVTLALAVLFGAGLMLGWLALGTAFGQKLAQILRLEAALGLAGSAFIGTFALSLGWGLVGLVDCFGPLVQTLWLTFGLGAVTLTRFGTLR